MIYTSGSTGLPKGAINAHRGICNRLLWMQEAYELDADDRVLQKAPSSFDVSVWEFFWPLLTGAQLVIAGPAGHHDPAYLARVIRQEKITTVHFVPSMLQVFLDQEELRTSCTSLRRTICSGEALAPALVERFFSELPGELHNLYGPAEAAVDVTFRQCQPEEAATTVPIGRPIANLRIYLLDACGRLVPRGIPGELHIGGVGVGRGYYNRPELTAEKFITASIGGVGTVRLYRTGDLARWNDDAGLEFLGRLDNQIKLRGMRIDLGEIEAVLRATPAVNDAAAVLEKGSAGQDQIVAYVTMQDGPSVTDGDILNCLRGHLPAAMIPTRIVRLERFPLSPNGKLDRMALTALAPVRPAGRPALAPRSALESAIADVWRDVLQLDSVGFRDNFFEVGGTSLLMVPVHARLRKTWDATLALVEMFQYPTVEALARRLSPTTEQVAPAPAIHRTAGADACTPPAWPAHPSPNRGRTIGHDELSVTQHQQNGTALDADIALIGMACRFPGASNPDEFWQLLVNGVEAIDTLSVEDSGRRASMPPSLPTRITFARRQGSPISRVSTPRFLAFRHAKPRSSILSIACSSNARGRRWRVPAMCPAFPARPSACSLVAACRVT